MGVMSRTGLSPCLTVPHHRQQLYVLSSLAKHEVLTIPTDVSPISLRDGLFLPLTRQMLNQPTVRIHFRFLPLWLPQKAIQSYLVLLILCRAFLWCSMGNSKAQEAFKLGAVNATGQLTD